MIKAQEHLLALVPCSGHYLCVFNTFAGISCADLVICLSFPTPSRSPLYTAPTSSCNSVVAYLHAPLSAHMLLCLLTLTPVSSGSLEYCVWLEKHSEPTKWFCEIGQVSTGHGKGDTRVLLFLVGTFLCFLREGLQQSFFGWWVLILTWRSIPSCHMDVLVTVEIPKHQTVYCPGWCGQ